MNMWCGIVFSVVSILVLVIFCLVMCVIMVLCIVFEVSGEVWWEVLVWVIVMMFLMVVCGIGVVFSSGWVGVSGVCGGVGGGCSVWVRFCCIGFRVVCCDD